MKILPHTLSTLTLTLAATLALTLATAAPAPNLIDSGTPAPTPEPLFTGTLTLTATTTITGTAPAISVPELSAQILSSAFAPTPGFDREAAAVAVFLEQFNFNRNAVKVADYASIVNDFMTAWDGQRYYFLQTDKDDFTKRYTAKWIYNNLTSLGKTDPAFDMFALYQKRVVDRINWIINRLKTDIDLTSHDTFLLDRKDAPWPADPAAADALWEQRLKFELIAEILNNKKFAKEKTPDDKILADAKTTIRKRYERTLKNFSEWEAKDVSERYLDTVARLYDPHSDYMSAETLEQFNLGITLQLIGIGATLGTEDDYCVIQEIMIGSPADLSKQLSPKDKIIAVAQDGEEPVDVVGMRIDKLVQLIRGKKGTKVHLTIIPASDSTKRKEVTIVRDIINLDTARARAAIYDIPDPTAAADAAAEVHGSQLTVHSLQAADESSEATAPELARQRQTVNREPETVNRGGEAAAPTIPIGVITLPSFYSAGKNDKGELINSCSQDVSTLIDKLQAAPGGIRGLVLDMRGNGGGSLPEAVATGGLFVKAGPIVQVKNPTGQVQVMQSEAPEPKYTGPLVILVNHFSASATEIVSGAMQKYGRALIIGDSSTHGKGTVQQVVGMNAIAPALARLNPKTGTMKFTIQKFYLPDGDSTQIKGVVSDLVLPNINDIFPIYEKDLPHALAWDEIPASKFDGHPLPPAIIAALRASSEQRQDTLDEFAYQQKSFDRFKTQYDEKTTPLNLNDRRAQKDSDKAFNKDQDKERHRLAQEAGYRSQEFLLVPEKAKNRTAETDKEEKKKHDLELRQSATAAPDNANRNDKTGEKKPDESTADDSDDDGLTSEQRAADAKKLDINLRETMRILLDQINLPAPPATDALTAHAAQ